MAGIRQRISGEGNINSFLGTMSGNIIAANQAWDLFAKAARAVVGPLNEIVKVGSAFQAQMQVVRSISKLTATEFKKLSQAARDIGATTEFTATQAAKAMENLTRAGLTATETLAVTGDVMALAAATGSDLATSADVVAKTLGVFADQGLKAKEAVDLMVQTVSASPQNFSNLSEALRSSQGLASSLGINFEELTVIIGSMAEVGFRGEQAGVALNAAMAKLLNPTSEGIKVLTELGLTVEDVNPKMNDFKDVIDTLNQSGIDEAQTLELLGQIAGTKFVKFIQRGRDAIDEFAEAQANANTASDATNIKLQDLESDMNMLNSITEELKITLFDTFDTELRDLVQNITVAIREATASVSKIKKRWTEWSIGIAMFNRRMLKLTNLFGQNDKAISDLNIEIGDMQASLGEVTRELDKKSLDNAAEHIVPKLAKSFGRTADEIDRTREAMRANQRAVKDQQAVVEELVETDQQATNRIEGNREILKKQQADIIKQDKDRLTLANALAKAHLQLAASNKKQAKAAIALSDAQRLAMAQAHAQAVTTLAANKAIEVQGLEHVQGRGDPAGESVRRRNEFLQGVGANAASQVVGVSGAIQGAQAGGPLGAIVGALAEIILANPKTQALLDELNEAIIELTDPIIEAVVPIMRDMVQILRDLKPITEILGKWLGNIMTIFRPVIQRLSDHVAFLSRHVEFAGEALEKLTPTMDGVAKGLALFAPAMETLARAMDTLAGNLGAAGSAGSSISGFFGSVGSALGFAEGGVITPDRMLTTPDETGAGLIKAHVGETVVPEGKASPSAVFNIKSINPREQAEAIWQIIEEGMQTGRLAI